MFGVSKVFEHLDVFEVFPDSVLRKQQMQGSDTKKSFHINLIQAAFILTSRVQMLVGERRAVHLRTRDEQIYSLSTYQSQPSPGSTGHDKKADY